MLRRNAAPWAWTTTLPDSTATALRKNHASLHPWSFRRARHLGRCSASSTETAVRDRNAQLAVAWRSLADLKTGGETTIESVVADAGSACMSHFSPGRWSDFTSDVTSFRDRASGRRWAEMKRDFGLNQTPGRLLLRFAVTNASPPWPLAALDPLLLLSAALLVLTAFGARAFAVSCLLLGSNWALRFFYWQGGSLLAYAALFFAVAAAASWRWGRPSRTGRTTSANGCATAPRLLRGRSGRRRGPAIRGAHRLRADGLGVVHHARAVAIVIGWWWSLFALSEPENAQPQRMRTN